MHSKHTFYPYATTSVYQEATLIAQGVRYHGYSGRAILCTSQKLKILTMQKKFTQQKQILLFAINFVQWE